MLSVGIDAGSRTIKVVVLELDTLAPVALGVVDQGIEQELLAMQLLDRLLASHGLSREQLGSICATGYGRKLIRSADVAVTEITCHGCGVHRLLPGTRTVIDIGGQDSKILHLNGNGVVADFLMNDRCAAGTGRFLEVLSTRLGVRLADLGDMVRCSRKRAIISSMCVVFAETEIVGLLASGELPEDIAAGVQESIATRVAAMAGHHLPEPVVFTGGVALVPGMKDALEASLGRPVAIAPTPQMTGALGAAIFAAQRMEMLPPSHDAGLDKPTSPHPGGAERKK
jgi:predicted CoA-substrate-specific enzyme activase